MPKVDSILLAALQHVFNAARMRLDAGAILTGIIALMSKRPFGIIWRPCGNADCLHLSIQAEVGWYNGADRHTETIGGEH